MKEINYQNDISTILNELKNKIENESMDLGKDIREKQLNFSQGDEVSMNFNTKKIIAMRNMDIKYSAINNDGEYLIDIKNPSENLPFSNLDESRIIGRYHPVSLSIATHARNPNILRRYDFACSVDDYEIDDVLIDKSAINTINNQKIENMRIEKYNGEYDERAVALKLWEKRTKTNLIDVFEMLDVEQTNILSSYSGKTSLWIQGLAGTGKSVLATEIFVKELIKKSNGLALFSTKEMKDKTNEHINELLNDDNERKYIVATYKEFDFLLKKQMKLYFNDFITHSGYALIRDKLKFIDIIFFNDTYQVIDISDDMKQLNFLITTDENIIKFLKILVNSYGFEEIYLDEDNLWSLFKFFKYYVEYSSELYIDASVNGIANTYDVERDISNTNIPNIFKKYLFTKLIMLDEAPTLLAYPYVSYFCKLITIRDEVITISAFDENQYSKYDMDKIWKYIHFDNKEILKTIYRTTKEIFGMSSKYLGMKWNAPVSIPDSVSFDEIFEDDIQLSWAIENFADLIGNEYMSLSVDIDIPVNEDNKHIYYLLLSRAVGNLSLRGKYLERDDDV